MIESCAAIVIAAKHHELTKVKDTRGTTNTVGTLRCRFEFRTTDWDYSAKTAMFCKGDAVLHPEVANSAIAVPLDVDNECAVPYEVLTNTLPYSIGVWGATEDGLRIVSRWLVFGAQPGCYVDGNAPADPEPTIYEQILVTSQNAVNVANDVLNRANSGEFDGKDGYTPVKGKDYFDGKDGTSISVESISESTEDGGDNIVVFSDGKTLTIKNGVKGSDGYTPQKNVDYFDGKDGVSTTHRWNGTTLTITSASGTSSVDLKGEKGDSIKGDKGDQGDKGDTGSAGSDGISATHKWDGTILTVTSASGTSSADLKGTPGQTPFIGENGNWWIGNEDTGVAASGGFSVGDDTVLVLDGGGANFSKYKAPVITDNENGQTADISEYTNLQIYDNASGQTVVV